MSLVVRDASTLPMPRLYGRLTDHEKWRFKLLWRTLWKSSQDTHLRVPHMPTLTKLCRKLIALRSGRRSAASLPQDDAACEGREPCSSASSSVTAPASTALILYVPPPTTMVLVTPSLEQDDHHYGKDARDESFDLLELHCPIVVAQSCPFILEQVLASDAGRLLPRELVDVVAIGFLNPYWWC